MSEDTSKIEKKELPKKTKKTEKVEKTNKKQTLSKTEKEKKEDKKFRPIENKSVQNKVIENIKNFISKIIEMQEKVRKDEQEEKETKKIEENEVLEAEESKEPQYLLEYYDLPFRYNETVVKILAQTPRRLFVYWDIADKDKQTYLNAFGNHFFEDTYPVLLVHNENKNYTSEIAINDFANSWYLDISNPRDKYTIQLGRKFKFHVKPQINPEIEETNILLSNDYLFIAISNKLEVPNDHVLFEEFKPFVTYRNVKTHAEETKKITSSQLPNNLQPIYQKLYQEQLVLDENGAWDMRNPSSMGTSSSIAK